VGAEVSQAMCDAGVQTLVMNGFGAKCIMVNKDVRHLETSAKPDGTPPDMHSKADIAIFEVVQHSFQFQSVYVDSETLSRHCKYLNRETSGNSQNALLHGGGVLENPKADVAIFEVVPLEPSS